VHAVVEADSAVLLLLLLLLLLLQVDDSACRDTLWGDL
jgi:hypothetical protein